MVQLSSRLFFVAALVASGLAAPNGKRSASATVIEADLLTLADRTSAFDKAVQAVPSVPPSTTALNSAVDVSAKALDSATVQATADLITPTTVAAFSEADGKIVLASYATLQPPLVDALSALVLKRPVLEPGGPIIVNAPVPVDILGDLQALYNHTVAFETALIGTLPADLKANATIIAKSIDSAFEKAIAAYDIPLPAL